MFVSSTLNNINTDNLDLTFIKSLNVKAFPCGRRRSKLIDSDNDPSTVGDQYSIPFDPEARLNTEANNRSHSSLNGYTQTYLDRWDADDKTLSLVLAGYLFGIDLKGLEGADQQAQINSFASATGSTANSIYANIRIEEVPLFNDEGLSYTTKVLRNQTASKFAEVCLDLPIPSKDLKDSENYYFSGLSFSASPVAGSTTEDDKYLYVLISDDDTRSFSNVYEITYKEDGKTLDKRTLRQQVVSLRVLDKVEDVWQIHEPARLPKIEHGNTANSIKVGKIFSEDISAEGNISATSIRCNGAGVTQLKLEKINDGNTERYQLQFTNTAKAT